MIVAFKHNDGRALGGDKIGESSGERDEKLGEIPIPPPTKHKNKFEHMPNHLRNKLDTTPDPPIFSHPTNNFQKSVRFVNPKGGVIGEKLSEKKPKEKRSEQPNPSLKQNPYGFIVTIVGEMVTRVSFASRGSVRREWLRSGLTRTGTTILMVFLSLVYHYPGEGPN
jgi:hypothetical protein